MSKREFNLFEEQKKLEKEDIEAIYGESKKPEDESVGVAEDTTGGDVPESKIDAIDRLMDEEDKRRRPDGRKNTGEKQVSGDFRGKNPEEIQTSKDMDEKLENETKEGDRNNLKEEIHDQLYEKIKEEFEKAVDKEAYIGEMRDNIKNFSNPSSEDRIFLNSLGFASEDKENQSKILEWYKEVGSESLDKIIKKEVSKPEAVKIREEEKTVEIEKFAEKLRVKNFENLTTDELKGAMEKIGIYFNEVRMPDIDINNKGLIARVGDVKSELARYNNEMKWILKNRQQKEKNKPQEIEKGEVEVTEKMKTEANTVAAVEKEAGVENIDDYFRDCKENKVKLRAGAGQEKTFIITSISGKGNVIRLKNMAEGENVKTSNVNKEFLYRFNNVKVSKEDLVNLKETIKENRSLFDGEKLNSFAIEGTIEKFLEDDTDTSGIDISDDSALIRALEVVKEENKSKEETEMKKHVPGALIKVFEGPLESLDSEDKTHIENEGETHNLEEQIEKYKIILNMLKDELESYGDEDFENRKEIEGFIKKLEKLIELMSELLELKKEGDEEKIKAKELEISDLILELKKARKEITEKNKLLSKEKEISDLGWNPDKIVEDEEKEISDLGWNPDKIKSGDSPLADEEKTLEQLKNKYREAEEDGNRNEMGYIAEKIRALEIGSEVDDKETPEDDLQKQLENLEAEYKKAEEDGDEEKKRGLMEEIRILKARIDDKETPEDDLQKQLEKLKAEYEKAEEDEDEEKKKNLMEEIRILKARIDDKAKGEDPVRSPIGDESDRPDEPGEGEPGESEKIELNEAEKEYIRKSEEIERLRKENKDILFIPEEDLTDEERKIVDRIQELEIGRTLDKGSGLLTNHVDELKRKVGTSRKEGILEAQKEYIEMKKLLIGVEMLEKGLKMKMERSKKERKLFPSIEKLSNSIENALKGKLKNPIGKKKKAMSKVNENYGSEKRKDLNSISEQELTEEFEKILKELDGIYSVSDKKTKPKIEGVYGIGIRALLGHINAREDIKTNHQDLKSIFEKGKITIKELPDSLSNPREYLSKMFDKAEDIFKEKIADNEETPTVDSGGELLEGLKDDMKKDLGELGIEKLNMLESLVSAVKDDGQVSDDTDGKELIDKLCRYNIGEDAKEAVSWIEKHKDNNEIKSIRLKDIEEFVSGAKKIKEELVKNLKDNIKKDLEDLEEEQLNNLENLISVAETSGQINDNININELIDKLQGYSSSPKIKDVTDWIEKYKNKSGVEGIKLEDIKKFIDDIK